MESFHEAKESGASSSEGASIHTQSTWAPQTPVPPTQARGPRRSFSGFTSMLDDIRSFPRRVRSKRHNSELPSRPPLSRGNDLLYEEGVPERTKSHHRLMPSAAARWIRRHANSNPGHSRPTHTSGSLFPENSPYAGDPDRTMTMMNGRDVHYFFPPSSGAAARAAAAASNESESSRCLKASESSVTRDTESGIGIDMREKPDEVPKNEFPMVRKDPFAILPAELVSQVLSFLDAPSLTNAELVCHRWHESASSRYAWKNCFIQEVHGVSPIQVDRRHLFGNGVGNSAADQEWKTLWKTRQALRKRWRDGKAAAIYLEGHKDSVYCVQFDEHKIVTGSRDCTVRVWDSRTFECKYVLGVPSRNTNFSKPPLPTEFNALHLRPMATVIATAHDSEPTALPISPYHHRSILCLQYDDEMMVTGSSDCTCIVWDVKAPYKPIKRLQNHTAGVLDICFDQRHIVTCSKDMTLCLWSRLTGELLKKFVGHRGPVNAVQLRDDLLVSASGDGVAKLWSLSSGLCIKEFPSKDRGMACVDFSIDSRTILAGGNDQIIYQFDTTSGELVRELKGHRGLVRSLHLDCVNGRVVSGSYDHSVRAYDLKDGNTIVEFNSWTTSWILGAKSDYRRIVAASQDSRVVIMDFGYQLPNVELLEG